MKAAAQRDGKRDARRHFDEQRLCVRASAIAKKFAN